MNKQQLKKTTAKGDFIFHKQWLEIFQNFSVEKAGQIIKALADYAMDGTKPADPELAAICAFLFAAVDIDRERIEEAHAPRKKAAKQTQEHAGKIVTGAQDIPFGCKISFTDENGNELVKTPPESLPENPEWVVNDMDKQVWNIIRNNLYNNLFPVTSQGRTYLFEPKQAFDYFKTYQSGVDLLTQQPA